MASLNLILSRRGLLHLAGRCRTKHGYDFILQDNEELIGFVMLAFRGLCQRCFPGTRS